jgi:hypothetical protein
LYDTMKDRPEATGYRLQKQRPEACGLWPVACSLPSPACSLPSPACSLQPTAYSLLSFPHPLAAVQAEPAPTPHRPTVDAGETLRLLTFLGLMVGIILIAFVIYQLALKPYVDRKIRHWKHKHGKW